MSDSDPAVLTAGVERAQERFQHGQGAVEAGLGDPDSDAAKRRERPRALYVQ